MATSHSCALRVMDVKGMTQLQPLEMLSQCKNTSSTGRELFMGDGGGGNSSARPSTNRVPQGASSLLAAKGEKIMEADHGIAWSLGLRVIRNRGHPLPKDGSQRVERCRPRACVS